MSFKTKKKPPNDIIDKKLSSDINNFLKEETIKVPTSPSISIPVTSTHNFKSIRTQSSSSSSSSKMISLNQNKQQSRKVSREITVNQRIRELFDTIRSRFTSNSNTRRQSKHSIRSNDIKKRNSSFTSSNFNNTNNNNNIDKIEHSQQETQNDQDKQENNSTTNLTSTSSNDDNLKQCRLCYNDLEASSFYKLSCCTHKFCINCLQIYLNYQITESRISITCPQCTEKLHPIDIYKLCENYNFKLIEKYEEFMLRRVLVTITDIRFCPAPDCNYAVIANGCANCPELKCLRPGCNTSFCYHCKQQWHPNITCEDAALMNRNIGNSSIININHSNSHISLISNIQFSTTSNKDEMKRCPKCQAPIVKMDDGSCNHITCAVCGCEFCWLCMKEISDLHYLSPSGCTFWGKKPWSRKKKILWQLGTLVGAPIGIALLASLAVPAIVIGLPIWSGRKVYTKFKNSNKHKRNIVIVTTVFGTLIISPIVAALTIGIGVPILLAYVYGVVPISLCRSGGGCGVTTNTNGVRFAFDDEDNFTLNNVNNSNFNSNSNAATTTNRSSILKTSNKKATKNIIHTQILDFDEPILNTGECNQNSGLNNVSPNTTSKSNSIKTKLDKKHKKSVGLQNLNKNQTKNSISTISTKQEQQDNQSINVNNPSIVGCESIGAFTTSLSASGSNIDRINDVNFVDDENDDVTNIENNDEQDRESSSNRSLAGSSKSRKSKISFDPKIEQNILKDNYSITMSEKSVNPSVVALAGSIKDNQSIDLQNNENYSLNHKISILSNNSEYEQQFQSNNNNTSDINNEINIKRVKKTLN